MIRALFLAVLLGLGLPPRPCNAFWPLSEPPAPTPPPSQQLPNPEADATAEMVDRIHQLALALSRNLAASADDQLSREAGLVVCTFVDLKKLYRSSSFGRYLADRLMNEFQQLDYRVVEMRMSSEVLIQENHGEHGLTRDPARVRPTVTSTTMLTGTYTLTPDQVLVNARVLDNRSGTVLASASCGFPRTALIDALLADQSTAKSGQQEIIYMKRLNL